MPPLVLPSFFLVKQINMICLPHNGFQQQQCLFPWSTFLICLLSGTRTPLSFFSFSHANITHQITEFHKISSDFKYEILSKKNRLSKILNPPYFVNLYATKYYLNQTACSSKTHCDTTSENPLIGATITSTSQVCIVAYCCQ